MTSISARVQKHRKNLRTNALGPAQILVPDTRGTGFARECARQSALLKKDAQEKEMPRFLAAAADRDGWKP